MGDNYSDRPDGLPGNDDSGAMSSWLAFHMMGLYPNAGQDYYLLNVPLLPAYTLSLANGRQLRVSNDADPTAAEGRFRVVFNGQELPDARIAHHQLMEGGELRFEKTIPQPRQHLTVAFTLNRQFRTWPLSYGWDGDTLEVVCKQTRYRIARSETEHATGFCWLHPQQDGTVYHQVKGTFLFLSADAMRQLEEQKSFVYDGITWRETEPLHVKADIDGTEMWIEQRDGLYLVSEMRGNPLGIDWKLTPSSGRSAYLQLPGAMSRRR